MSLFLESKSVFSDAQTWEDYVIWVDGVLNEVLVNFFVDEWNWYLWASLISWIYFNGRPEFVMSFR